MGVARHSGIRCFRQSRCDAARQDSGDNGEFVRNMRLSLRHVRNRRRGDADREEFRRRRALDAGEGSFIAVAYHNFPSSPLPLELRDENPCNIWRLMAS
jgi:hypothetical protein